MKNTYNSLREFSIDYKKMCLDKHIKINSAYIYANKKCVAFTDSDDNIFVVRDIKITRSDILCYTQNISGDIVDNGFLYRFKNDFVDTYTVFLSSFCVAVFYFLILIKDFDTPSKTVVLVINLSNSIYKASAPLLFILSLCLFFVYVLIIIMFYMFVKIPHSFYQNGVFYKMMYDDKFILFFSIINVCLLLLFNVIITLRVHNSVWHDYIIPFMFSLLLFVFIKTLSFVYYFYLRLISISESLST